MHNCFREDNPVDRLQPNSLTGGRSTGRDRVDLYDPWLSLSAREWQVTYLACHGGRNDQIAFQMGITKGTVKSYPEHVYFKIDVRNKVELRLQFRNFDFTHNLP